MKALATSPTGHIPHLINLTTDEVAMIDAAAGDILDNGFGRIEVKIEYGEICWITKTIPIKVPPPHKVA